jgi:protein-tyrosine phosphatase
MTTPPYWISAVQTGKLALSPKPQGGDQLRLDLSAWQSVGISVLVCLLTEAEQSELELEQEGPLWRSMGLIFIHYPMADYSIPTSMTASLALIRQLQAHLRAGEGVLVHCRGGIGRSGLLCSSLLVAQGYDPASAMQIVSQARGVESPETDSQREWVHQLALISQQA